MWYYQSCFNLNFRIIRILCEHGDCLLEQPKVSNVIGCEIGAVFGKQLQVLEKRLSRC